MKTLEFQRIIESVKENKTIYTLNDFDGCTIWIIENSNLDAINKEIRKNGLFYEGVKVFQPVILPPKDALDEAAKKIASEVSDVRMAQHRLSKWPMQNYQQLLPLLTKDYSNEIDKTPNEGFVGIRYRLARAFIEKYTCGLLAAPFELNDNEKFKEFCREWHSSFHRLKMHKDMHNIIGVKNAFYEGFVHYNNLANVKEYKVYRGYNIDQDVEDKWGRALDAL